MPVAEATGLIVEIGEHVLRQPCAQAGRWRREGRDFTVSVNVSRRQLLEPGFVEVVRAALKHGGVPGQVLFAGGFARWHSPGLGDPFVIREFMRQIGIPARIEP